MTSQWTILPALAGLLALGLAACGTTSGADTPDAAAGGDPTRADAAATGGAPTPDASTDTPDAATPDARGGRADAALVPFDAATPGGDARTTGPTPDGGDGADAGPSCLPDRHAWDLEMHGLVDTYCGQCHGDPVAYGAPYPLIDYDALFRPIGGARPVDALANALNFDRMPPAGQPHPTDEETARLVAWATCGDPPDRPAGPAGLEVSAEPLPAPAAPPNLPFFDLRADEFPLAEDASNPYICFAFDAPADAQGLMRRIEPLLDDQRVVHHLVLMHDREGGRPGGYECAGIFEEWIYAWGPGEGPLQFPEGGLRLSPGDRFIVQIHYNNGGRFPNVRDSSGVRIYYGPDEGPEYGLTALGPTNFVLPARERTQATGYCTFREPVDVLSSWPHMHELGYALESTILRADAPADAEEERLISLRGWHFESQWIYSTPTRMEAGDAVRTTCTFDNIRDRDIGFGPGTEDEMCFNFVYTTPPLNNPFCDGPPPPQAGADPFVPGECAPPGVMPGALPWVDGALLEGQGADPVGDGREPLGMWVLESGELWMGSFQTPVGVIDGVNSRYSARGYAMFVGDGNGYVDLQTSIHAAVVGGQALDVPLGGSFSGPLHAGDAATPGTIDVACGQFGEQLSYAVDAQGRLVVGTHFDPGIPVTIVARFVRP